MTIVMATKRGANGLRKWLVFDTERKEFAWDLMQIAYMAFLNGCGYDGPDWRGQEA